MALGLIALVCRSGGEYGPIHANWLLDQKKLSFDGFVLSDFPEDQINATVIPFSHNFPGWWSKMELFRPDLPQCPILYIDLDTVVKRIPDRFFDSPQSLMLRDLYNEHKSASGLMLIRPEDRKIVWDAFIADPNGIMARHPGGDQDFIRSVLPHNRFQTVFPEDKIFSYKAHFSPERGKKHYIGGGDINEARFVCFHGKPRPWEVKEEWIQII